MEKPSLNYYNSIILQLCRQFKWLPLHFTTSIPHALVHRRKWNVVKPQFCICARRIHNTTQRRFHKFPMLETPQLLLTYMMWGTCRTLSHSRPNHSRKRIPKGNSQFSKHRRISHAQGGPQPRKFPNHKLELPPIHWTVLLFRHQFNSMSFIIARACEGLSIDRSKRRSGRGRLKHKPNTLNIYTQHVI